MNLHEFQAKQILKKYGITIPEFFVASTLEEVEKELRQRCWNEAVVKVQVHAGGRGKAGGVKVAHSQAEILAAARDLLKKKIVNAQTGVEGLISHQILVTSPVSISQEYYLSFIIDRSRSQQLLIASPEGGVEIEQVMQHTPEKVLLLPIPLARSLRPYHLLRVIKFMGWQGELAVQGEKMIRELMQAFVEADASLLEVNPLVATKEGKLVALDVKLVVDDNALFRQPELKKMFDPSQVSVSEALAQEYDLAYVALNGSIGCMVNGAGLAMATMDIIHYYGGKPANFLDIGGGASKEKVAEGFKIILSDPHVKAIFVNIFGGIMNCEVLAMGLIEAVRSFQSHVPLVVRMQGTSVEKGKERLQESGLEIMIMDDLSEAAQKVVEMAE